MQREDRHPGRRDERDESFQPVVDAAAGAVQKQDGGKAVVVGVLGLKVIEPYGSAAEMEGRLHGDYDTRGCPAPTGMIADGMLESHEAEKLAQRLAAGDVRALARAISTVEDGSEGSAELLAACKALGRKARRIGVTGPPGAGKSTLVDQVVQRLRDSGETVGVVAVDPTSPYTGGALLGDRIRMQGFAGDDGVYIRSMASRGALGGVARTADAVCAVMEAAGRATVIIESVGVGQDEVAIAGLVDVTILVLVPGMGDDIQSLKAGVMEVADIFCVNKSDQPGAERVEAEILAMQGLSAPASGWIAPVVKTVATTGEGVADLLAAVEQCVSAKTTKRIVQSDFSELKLDHLGIAVKSIAAARGFYEMLGMSVAHEETVEHEQVKAAMLPMGESRIELLEATADDSTIGKFLAKRGEGLHHVAVKVDRLDERFVQMQKAGVRLASDRVRVGAGGHRYFFVHPASTGGVLLELVGA
jgi:LAO/AO transport system kinase